MAILSVIRHLIWIRHWDRTVIAIVLISLAVKTLNKSSLRNIWRLVYTLHKQLMLTLERLLGPLEYLRLRRCLLWYFFRQVASECRPCKISIVMRWILILLFKQCTWPISVLVLILWMYINLLRHLGLTRQDLWPLRWNWTLPGAWVHVLLLQLVPTALLLCALFNSGDLLHDCLGLFTFVLDNLLVLKWFV